LTQLAGSKAQRPRNEDRLAGVRLWLQTINELALIRYGGMLAVINV
jgi:hypothetical protein